MSLQEYTEVAVSFNKDLAAWTPVRSQPRRTFASREASNKMRLEARERATMFELEAPFTRRLAVCLAHVPSARAFTAAVRLHASLHTCILRAWRRRSWLLLHGACVGQGGEGSGKQSSTIAARPAITCGDGNSPSEPTAFHIRGLVVRRPAEGPGWRW